MPETKKDNSALYTPAAIIIAGALIGAGLMYGLKGSTPTNTGNTPTPRAVNIADVKTDGEPFIGRADAPVTLAYWFDYQCPFCKAVEVGHPQIPTPAAMPDLIEQYVDTGKVKIVFKDFAFLGDDSFTAVDYSHAVWKLYPDKFFEWHEAMFNAQDEEHAGFGDEESTYELTKTIAGIDADKVRADATANSAAYRAEAAEDQTEGQSFGIQGTPGFITGKVSIDGAQAFPAFKAAIDAQL